MARSEREIFSDHVTVLARKLGLELDDMPEQQRDRLLSHARRRRHLNEHEAALSLAYAHLPELLADDVEAARVLSNRLALMVEQWADEQLVDARLLAPLQREARAHLRHADR